MRGRRIDGEASENSGKKRKFVGRVGGMGEGSRGQCGSYHVLAKRAMLPAMQLGLTRDDTFLYERMKGVVA